MELVEGSRASSPNHEAKALPMQGNSAFLQLPGDVVALVMEKLELQHRQVLSETCRDLCSLYRALPSLRSPLTREQKFHYLACIARDFPDQWVCPECLALHRSDPRDTPETSVLGTCPRSRGTLNQLNGIEEPKGYRIDHRHVQLALKHLRMWGVPSMYSAQMLAPLENSTVKPHRTSTVRHSVCPKVRMGKDGNLRYLTLSTWVFERRGRWVPMYGVLSRLSPFSICRHHHLYPLNGYTPAAFAQESENGAAPVLHSACTWCPTDVAIRVLPSRAKPGSRWCRRVELRAWQDLGTEGSPSSLAQRDHSMGLILDTPAWDPDRNSVYRGDDPKPPSRGFELLSEPGSVRALYEGDEGVRALYEGDTGPDMAPRTCQELRDLSIVDIGDKYFKLPSVLGIWYS